MSAVLAAVGRLRVYVVALVVWAIAVTLLTMDPAGSAPGLEVLSGVRAVGYVFGFLLIVALVRCLWPMRVMSDGRRLVAGGRTYRVHLFTGMTNGVSKHAITETTGEGRVSGDSTFGVVGSMSIRSRTTVHDQFFLAGPGGQQQAVQVHGAHLPVGDGQWVTAAWAIAEGKKTGPYFVVTNHSTTVTSWIPPALFRMAFGGRVGVYVLWAFLTGICLMIGGDLTGLFVLIGSILVFGVGSRLQISALTRVRSRPLLAAMAAAGAQPPQPLQDVVVATPAPVSPASSPPSPVVPPPPPPPPLPAGPAAPPAWATDPHGRHQHRYWDGARWTDHVSDDGVPGVDSV